MEGNLSNYKAVILAGGKGTRLYPITREIPKPLLPIKKKPIINYLVDLFFEKGIKDIAVLINQEFKEDFDWWKKRYYDLANSSQKPEIIFFEEKQPLGTFGGLWFLKKWLGNHPFFLTNGDELKQIDLIKMADFHRQINPLGTIALLEVPNPSDYGVVVCHSDWVEEFLEKPSPSQIAKKLGEAKKYINSGLYLFSPEILKYHSGPKYSMIEKDIFPLLAKEKKLLGFKFQGKWADCGNWQRYEKAISGWE